MNEPRVLRITVPCPYFEGHSTVYVLPVDPLTLIDTGVGADHAYQAFSSGLAEHGLQVADIQRVILTHKHIDHIGNAWRVQRESGAEILIHEVEQQSVADVDHGGKRFLQHINARLLDWCVPVSERPQVPSDTLPNWVLESADARPLIDGQLIDMPDHDIEVIHTPGHTMGSVCLKYGPILFSGDHILPDVSPNVGVDVHHRGMLRHYLSSLTRIQDRVRDITVMPGHGEPFTDLGERVRQLRQHHEQRLERVLEILRDGPRNVYETARALFGELRDFHVFLGCAEADTHLELLEEEGRVAFDQGTYRLA